MRPTGTSGHLTALAQLSVLPRLSRHIRRHGERLEVGNECPHALGAEVFNSIYFGRPHGMPAFGGALGTEGVWTLVTYLQSLPVPPNVATESWQN